MKYEFAESETASDGLCLLKPTVCGDQLRSIQRTRGEL